MKFKFLTRNANANANKPLKNELVNDKNVFVSHSVTDKNDKNVFVSHSVNDIDDVDNINDFANDFVNTKGRKTSLRVSLPDPRLNTTTSDSVNDFVVFLPDPTSNTNTDVFPLPLPVVPTSSMNTDTNDFVKAPISSKRPIDNAMLPPITITITKFKYLQPWQRMLKLADNAMKIVEKDVELFWGYL